MLRRFEPLPEHYAGQFYRFHQAWRDRSGLPVTRADARRSIEMIAAMYHSSETGMAVTLPVATDHPKYASWLPQAA